MDRTRTVAVSWEEWTLLGHGRGYCHDSSVCALCKAERRAFEAEQALNSIIEGVPS